MPKPLRRLLVGYDVRLASEMGWATMQNGKLLAAAEEGGFHVFITCDQSLSHQQNLKGRKLSLVVLSTNYWNYIRPNADLVLAAVKAAVPSVVQRVEIPVMQVRSL